jgi:DNA-binding response OmpR family regulator
MKGRILVVDDEAVARITLLKILQLEGYEVMAVSSGQEALNELAKNSYDVMILDLKMPGMTGMEVLRKLIDAKLDTRVIFLTAYGSMDTALQALRYRVQDYLLKPISPGDILRSVRKAILDTTNHQLGGEPGTDTTVQHNGQYQIGGEINIDCRRRTISSHLHVVQLTPTEARVMEILLDDIGHVVSHSDLVWRVQGYRISALDAAKILRPVMSRLRNKLADIPGAENWIQNVRGSGYVFEKNPIEK